MVSFLHDMIKKLLLVDEQTPVYHPLIEGEVCERFPLSKADVEALEREGMVETPSFRIKS